MATKDVLPAPSAMKIRELKAELASYGICAVNILEKADLIRAVESARRKRGLVSSPPAARNRSGGNVQGNGSRAQNKPMRKENNNQGQQRSRQTDDSRRSRASTPSINAMSIKQLKHELDSCGISSAQFFDKRDLQEAVRLVRIKKKAEADVEREAMRKKEVPTTKSKTTTTRAGADRNASNTTFPASLSESFEKKSARPKSSQTREPRRQRRREDSATATSSASKPKLNPGQKPQQKANPTKQKAGSVSRQYSWCRDGSAPRRSTKADSASRDESPSLVDEGVGSRNVGSTPERKAQSRVQIRDTKPPSKSASASVMAAKADSSSSCMSVKTDSSSSCMSVKADSSSSDIPAKAGSTSDHESSSSVDACDKDVLPTTESPNSTSIQPKTDSPPNDESCSADAATDDSGSCSETTFPKRMPQSYFPVDMFESGTGGVPMGGSAGAGLGSGAPTAEAAAAAAANLSSSFPVHDTSTDGAPRTPQQCIEEVTNTGQEIGSYPESDVGVTSDTAQKKTPCSSPDSVSSRPSSLTGPANTKAACPSHISKQMSIAHANIAASGPTTSDESDRPDWLPAEDDLEAERIIPDTPTHGRRSSKIASFLSKMPIHN